jgi:hypothetical protein
MHLQEEMGIQRQQMEVKRGRENVAEGRFYNSHYRRKHGQ